MCCRFASTTPLTGEVVKINIGQFLNLGTSAPNQNLYQSTYMTGLMTYIGSIPANQNHQAYLEVIDDYNFKVCIDFIAIDYNGWLTASNGSILGGISGSLFSISAQVNGMVAQCDFPVELNEFGACDFQTELAGYRQGEDLVVTINATGVISNNFYIGFFDESQIGGQQDIFSDYLQYAQIGNGVNDVITTNGDTLPNSCIISGTGFVSGSSTVTIDGSCLNGGCYRLYAVYFSNGQWHSCLSEPIKEAANQCPPIWGPTEFTLTDITGANFIGCCFTNVSPCGELKFRTEMEASAYNTMLADLGKSGDILSNLISGSITLNGNTIDSVLDLTGPNPAICGTINNPTLSGTQEIEYNFVFDLGDHKDYISGTCSVTFNTAVEETTFTINSENKLGVICAEDEEVLDIELPVDCKSYLTLDGNVISEIIDGQLDTSMLEIGVCYCIKSICEGVPTTEECECPPCEPITINATVVQSSPIGSVPIFGQIQANLIGGGGTIVLDIFHNNTNTQITGSQFIPATSFICSDVQTDICGASFQFSVIMDDGCVYGTNGFTTILSSNPENQVLVLQPLTTNQPECDCPEDPECEASNIALDYECVDGVLTINYIEDLNGTVLSNLKECSTDGGATWDACTGSYTNQNVSIRWVVEIEGCDTLVLNQEINCFEVTECLNTRILNSCSILSGNIELDFTDNFSSNTLSDKVKITIDGITQTFDVATYTPIPLTGQINSIETCTIFEDGCADLILSFPCEIDSTDCNFDACTFECEPNETDCTISWRIVCPNGVTGLVLVDNDYPLEGNVGILPYIGLAKFLIISSKPGCPDKTKSKFCLVKQNFCCDEEVECSEFGPIVCQSKVMSFPITSGTGEGYEYQWCAPDGSLLGTGLTQEVSVDGIYVLKITSPSGCPDVDDLEYPFNGGAAGIGGSGTVTKN